MGAETVAKKTKDAGRKSSIALENEKTFHVTIKKLPGNAPSKRLRDNQEILTQILNGYTIEINGLTPALFLTTARKKGGKVSFDEEKQWQYIAGYAEEVIRSALLQLFIESEIVCGDPARLEEEITSLMSFTDDHTKYAESAVLPSAQGWRARLVAGFYREAWSTSSRLRGESAPSPSFGKSLRLNSIQSHRFYVNLDCIWSIWREARSNHSKGVKGWQGIAIKEFEEEELVTATADSLCDLFRLLEERKPNMEHQWKTKHIALVHSAREAGLTECDIKKRGTLEKIYEDIKGFYESMGVVDTKNTPDL
jgi:hypothetical protein